MGYAVNFRGRIQYRVQTEGVEKDIPFYAIDLLGELLNLPLD